MREAALAGYLQKTATLTYADESSETVDMVTQLITAGVAMGIPALAGHFAMKKLQERASELPKVPSRDIRKINKDMGLGRDYVQVQMPGIGNAFFMDEDDARSFATSAYDEPESIWTDEASKEMYRDTQGNLEKSLRVKGRDNVLNKLQGKAGILGYDPDIATRGIMAHEAGHAKIEEDGGFGRFNQKYLRAVLPTLGSLGGLFGGMAVGKHIGGRAELHGGAVGMAVGGTIGMLPVILSERLATKKANDYLDKTYKGSPEGKAKEKDLLRKALITYYIGAVGPAIAGLLYMAQNEAMVASGHIRL